MATKPPSSSKIHLLGSPETEKLHGLEDPTGFTGLWRPSRITKLSRCPVPPRSLPPWIEPGAENDAFWNREDSPIFWKLWELHWDFHGIDAKKNYGILHFWWISHEVQYLRSFSDILPCHFEAVKSNDKWHQPSRVHWWLFLAATPSFPNVHCRKKNNSLPDSLLVETWKTWMVSFWWLNQVLMVKTWQTTTVLMGKNLRKPSGRIQVPLLVKSSQVWLAMELTGSVNKKNEASRASRASGENIRHNDEGITGITD